MIELMELTPFKAFDLARNQLYRQLHRLTRFTDVTDIELFLNDPKEEGVGVLFNKYLSLSKTICDPKTAALALRITHVILFYQNQLTSIFNMIDLEELNRED